MLRSTASLSAAQTLTVSRLFFAATLLGAAADSVPGSSARLRGSATPDGQRQVLVFDAGSSGTRIHVFNIQAAPGSHVPIIDLAVRGQQTLKIKPGLSSYAAASGQEAPDLDGAQRSIEQLLTFAGNFVLEARRQSTPVLLKATAGLRAVSLERAEAVLERVRDTLQKSGYAFRRDWADVIMGKEEAGLAWVSANYLRGTFASQPSQSGGAAEEQQPSLGVIEMGGGSTQVAFEVPAIEATAVRDPDRFTFTTVLGKHYMLYAHSYLGYGLDYAQSQLKGVVPSSTPGSDEATDPCYPVGYQRPHSVAALAIAVADSTSRSAVVKGSGDSAACQAAIRQHLLGSSRPEAPGRYDGELPVRGVLAATENFFYVRDRLSLALSAEPADMHSASTATCAAAWTPEAGEGGAAACFALSYQEALLQALRVPTTPGVRVEIKRQINGGDVDWALGAALMHAIGEGRGSDQDHDVLRLTTAGGGTSGLSPITLVAALLLSLLVLLGLTRTLRGRALYRQLHVGVQQLWSDPALALKAATIGRSAAARDRLPNRDCS